MARTRKVLHRDLLSRDEFMRRLGIARSYFFRLVGRGVLPAPPRLPDSRIIQWHRGYLRECRRALAAHRRMHARRLRLKTEELRRAGLI